MSRTFTQDEATLLKRIVKELRSDDREFWNSLTDAEKLFIREAIREIEESGTSLKLQALYEFDFLIKPPTFKEALAANYNDPKTGELTNYWFGPDATKIFPYWRDELCEVLAPDSLIFEWIMTGPIGGGKTTAAVIAQMFRLIELMCLRDPYTYHGLMRNAPIVYQFCNVTQTKALETAYAQMVNTINMSPFFREHCPINTRKVFDQGADSEDRYSIELPRGVKLRVGARPDSAISANVISAVLDEMSFKELKTAKSNDYSEMQAFQLYSNIRKRIESRFVKEGKKIPSLLCNISSKKSTADFLEKHIEKVAGSPNVRVSSAPIYVMKPIDQFSKKTFRVLIGDKFTNHRILREDEEAPAGFHVENVPINFRQSFDLDLDNAIRDICGIATHGEQPLLRDRERLKACINHFRANPFPNMKHETAAGPRFGIISSTADDVLLETYLNKNVLCQMWGQGYRPRNYPGAARFLHLDLSQTGDATGIAMGCISDIKHLKRPVINDPERSDGSLVPFIVPVIWYDFLLRVIPPLNGEIDYSKIRQLIFTLRDVMNFPIKKVTADTHQSFDMLQQLSKANFETDIISMDRDDSFYLGARMAVSEGRMDMPLYEPFTTEVLELVHNTKGAKGKVDHRLGGSKDVADAWCGVQASIGLEKDFTLLIDAPAAKPEIIMPHGGGNRYPGQSFVTTNMVQYGDLLDSIKD